MTALRLLTAALLLTGCSAAKDMENLCHAEERSGADSAGQAERATRMALWLSDTIKTSKVKRALGEAALMSPEERTVFLRKLAIECGYEGPCPLLDDPTSGPARSP